MAKQRPSIPVAVETRLLTESRRRCCLCFGLSGDPLQKDGQVAHVDRNPRNNRLDNLVWLCLHHHDEYDTVRSQTKRITQTELKAYRAELYAKIDALMSKVARADDSDFDEEDIDPAVAVMDRYSGADKSTDKVIASEILMRLEQIYQFSNSYLRATDSLGFEDPLSAHAETAYFEIERTLRAKLKLPDGIWGLCSGGPLPALWKKAAGRIAKDWSSGLLSYDRCIDIFWHFDEEFDLDPYYLLFGLPHDSLRRLQLMALNAFVFEHGQRHFVRSSYVNEGDIPF